MLHAPVLSFSSLSLCFDADALSHHQAARCPLSCLDYAPLNGHPSENKQMRNRLGTST